MSMLQMSCKVYSNITNRREVGMMMAIKICNYDEAFMSLAFLFF